MSQRFPASRPASCSPADVRRITLPPVQLRDDARLGVWPSERQNTEPEGRAPYAQPQPSPQDGQSTSSGEEWRPGPSRDLGVHSMLNPPDSESSRLRHRLGESTESPLTFGQHHTSSIQQHSSHTSPGTENYASTFPRGPRQILTPKSPARIVSAGRIVMPGTIDAQKSPFLPPGGRSFTESGTSTPSVPPNQTPPPPSQQHQHYGFPPSGYAPSVPLRRPEIQAPARTPVSQSTSPSISTSSFNTPSSQTSPASFLTKGVQTPHTSTSYYPGPSFGNSMSQEGGMQVQGLTGNPEGPYSIPVTQSQRSPFQSSSAGSSRQTSASDSIQVLTITTAEGLYTVPVDVHQASRLADEKRARNAGASARFRQRRKEREKEANSAIEKLQSQTRDLERRLREAQAHRDFYRAERDRYRDAVFRTPDLRHLTMQAPPSPVPGRLSSFQQGQMGMRVPPPPPAPSTGYQEQSPERASRRRRSDIGGNFTDVPYTPPATALPPVLSAYASGGATQVTSQPSPVRPLLSFRGDANFPQSSAPAISPTTAGPTQDSTARYSHMPFESGWPGNSARR